MPRKSFARRGITIRDLPRGVAIPDFVAWRKRPINYLDLAANAQFAMPSSRHMPILAAADKTGAKNAAAPRDRCRSGIAPSVSHSR